MTDFIKTQNSFAHGEVSPDFYAQGNIDGLSRMQNMDITSGGGLSRRSGLRQIGKLAGPARLVSFSVSDGQEYILALTDYHMDIYLGDTLVQDLITPWSYNDLSVLQYAQRFGTMIFVHPDYCPQTLVWQTNRFYISEFSFARNDSDLTINIPFVRFDDTSDITITVTSNSTGNNYATFTTSCDFWTLDNVGGFLYLLDMQWTVVEYISPTQVVAHTNGSYTLPSSPVSTWSEAAFGTRRGWPRSITFHQDRLIFGGSRDWPGGIWMSQVGRHNNFNSGTGLDDEAIFVSLLSQQRQQICTVVSSDNLQILTSTGEWAISSKPLTPSSVDIKQHTSVGSYAGRYLPPQKIEGSTIFVSASGHDIRELSLDDFGENYNANDLSLYAKHLMTSPIDISYNDREHRLYIVRSDGVMSVLNQCSSLGISGWGTYRTSGAFLSVATCCGITYVMVCRGSDVFLECFDSGCFDDAGTYSFSYIASGLPLIASGHNSKRIRLRKIVARLLNTKSIQINNHRISLPNDIYSATSNGYSGDVSLNLLGTTHDCLRPVWTIHGSESYPITVLSLGLHGWYTV